MEHWECKLTPFDAEIALMVESLTGKECKAKNGENHYFFEVDYSDHVDPDYIQAIWQAIEGKVGERLIEISDMPDLQRLIVRVKFSKEKLPKLVQYEKTIPHLEVADKFCQNVVWALQVDRKRADKIAAFVGGGEIEIPDEGEATYHFVDPIAGIWKHAKEKDFILHTPRGFEIIPEKDFKTNWMPAEVKV